MMDTIDNVDPAQAPTRRYQCYDDDNDENGDMNIMMGNFYMVQRLTCGNYCHNDDDDGDIHVKHQVQLIARGCRLQS